MGEVRTRADSRTAAGASTPAGGPWKGARRVWPVLAMLLAVLLWWPTAFRGRAGWMHLPFTQGDAGVGPASGDAVLLGTLVAAAVVSALVTSPWPRSRRRWRGGGRGWS